jgi:hypothetical protein
MEIEYTFFIKKTRKHNDDILRAPRFRAHLLELFLLLLETIVLAQSVVLVFVVVFRKKKFLPGGEKFDDDDVSKARWKKIRALSIARASPSDPGDRANEGRGREGRHPAVGAQRARKKSAARIRRTSVAALPLGKSDHAVSRDGELLRVDVFETDFRRRRVDEWIV